MIEERVPLASYTTLHVGGPARYFARVRTIAELSAALSFAEEHSLPFFVLGGGSNILVPDEGFPGVVVKMEPREVRVTGTEIHADAGALTRLVAMTAARRGLAGMEHLAGIPGTIGGAIRGNAGSFGSETKDSLKRVDVLHRTKGTWREETLPKESLTFSYRDSTFKRDPSYVVWRGVFQLQRGDREKSEAVMKEDLRARRARQPYEFPSAGSVFKNPDGRKARALIEAAGCKGLAVGRAEVSRKHANFIVNRGGAAASDILSLIEEIKKRVRDTSGVTLEEEIVLV